MFVINHLHRDYKDPRRTSGVFCRQFGKLGDRANRCTLVAFSGLLLLSSFTPGAPVPASVNPKTYEAFAKYVRAADERNRAELRRGAEFLWIDALPDAERKRRYGALSQGEVQIKQRNSSEPKDGFQCPECMIHHWIGLVFIPGAKLDSVLHVLEDYNHHADYYAPDVVKSQIESRDGDHFRVFLRFRRQKVITVVLNTQHDITYFRDSGSRARSRSSATHIGEVDNPGKRNERERPRQDDNGFLWGMETWWRMEEKNEGVYVQSEVVSLTRNIPAGLGWMIGPFVTSVPKESLTFTLEATRKAVLAQPKLMNGFQLR